MGQQITLTVNGESITRETEPQLLLVSFIRETLRLTGTYNRRSSCSRVRSWICVCTK